ncbi:hypothetical protein GGF50DRAFT_106884 [Schizophyllum commune]
MFSTWSFVIALPHSSRIFSHGKTQGRVRGKGEFFDYHAAVYALGRRFAIDNAEKDAKAALDRIVHNMIDESKKNKFLTARIYALGVEFDVREWRVAALRRLLRRAARWYTIEEIQFLGLPTFLGVMRARESQVAHRLRFARTPMPLCHTFSCRDNGACQAAFAGVWWRHVAPDVTHPSAAESWSNMTMGDIVNIVKRLDEEGVFTRAGVSQGCWKATYKYYGAQHQSFRAEEVIFDALLNHLKAVPHLMTNWYISP